jgi:hypothetical protein
MRVLQTEVTEGAEHPAFDIIQESIQSAVGVFEEVSENTHGKEPRG